MKGVRVDFRLFVSHSSWCHISFHPNNWFDVLAFALFVEFYHSVHGPMVCQRQRVHTQFFDTANNLGNFPKPIKERIVRMGMEMNKFSHIKLNKIITLFLTNRHLFDMVILYFSNSLRFGQHAFWIL